MRHPRGRHDLGKSRRSNSLLPKLGGSRIHDSLARLCCFFSRHSHNTIIPKHPVRLRANGPLICRDDPKGYCTSISCPAAAKEGSLNWRTPFQTSTVDFLLSI